VVVSGLLFFFLPSESRGTVAEKTTLRELGKALKNAPTWISIAAYLLFNISFWGFIGWIPTYLQEQRHVSLHDLGFIGSLPFAFGFVGLLAIGQLGTGVFSSRRSLLVGLCYLFSAAFFFVALKGSSVFVCVGGLSFAAFFLLGAFGPFWGSILDLAPAGSRGAFSGVVNFGGQVGGFLGQIAIGGLADKMKNFDGAILLMVCALVLGAGCMFGLNSLPLARRGGGRAGVGG
jgi:sugar phosphate permease